MKQRIAGIQERIRAAAESCGRDPASIRLVAVSKTVAPDLVRQAAAAGVSVFGENYIQEARDKIAALTDINADWHFIGHLQSNKAKYAVKLFSLIHSVDSVKLAAEIDKQARKISKTQQILLQINTGGEAAKSGVAVDEGVALARDIHRFENVRIKGLMTLPPYYNAPEKVAPYFKSLREIGERIREAGFPGVSMDTLSMGMTGDFETAIQEGATLVRIGTAIFGERA